MILSLLLAMLAFAALLPIVLPLLRPAPPTPDAAAYDQAVYRDQLRELDRDLVRGVLTPAEAQSARLEIQRRLLAAADTDPAPVVRASARLSGALAIGLVALIGLGSVGLYLHLGVPTRNDMTAAREEGQRMEVQRMIVKLRERLVTEPNNADAWAMLGRAAAALADWQEAVDSYQRALTLTSDPSADLLAAYGEVLAARAGGVVTAQARQSFQAALVADPANGMARFYMAVSAAQDGDPKAAIDLLQGLAADLPADAPVRPEIARRLAAFAAQAGVAVPPLAAGQPVAAALAGPDEETMAAARNLPEGERKEMIRGMVARLAERLEKHPSDADGWMRLGRSWSVLGEAEKSADAYEKAAALRPDDPWLPLRAVEALLKGRAMTDPIPPRAVEILRRVEAVKPDEPAVLWYLGLVAAREGQRDQGIAYWRRLLAQLPPESPDARMVRTAIDALGQGGGEAPKRP